MLFKFFSAECKKLTPCKNVILITVLSKERETKNKSTDKIVRNNNTTHKN